MGSPASAGFFHVGQSSCVVMTEMQKGVEGLLWACMS